MARARHGTTAEPARRTAIRCAIYTRKSTEEGLDQAFNSLDAQREACAAYILSQRHEGWSLVPEYYDDGGYSGGTMERPGLKQLLADIEARKVDVIVVYKVDRLTRSLADFAKIVEILDAKGASFVSVTQAFNTTTSMGRLTLNVLLSFAQFEREVTGERIRDKIAASKAKGMWMGGLPPLGYDVRDRKLVVNEPEADTVRTIFTLYLRLGSVFAVQRELAMKGIRSKARMTAEGCAYGSKPISRGALYLLLQNRLYLGEVVHKGAAYPGEHPAIVDPELFEAAQGLLERNRIDRIHGANAREPSLLAGLLWDGQDRRMSPSHAVKQSKRYRYYVSQCEGGDKPKIPLWRVPAGDLESMIFNRVGSFLRDDHAVHDAIPTIDAVAAEAMLRACRTLNHELTEASPSPRRAILLRLLQRIIVHADRVEIEIARHALADLAGLSERIPDSVETGPITLTVLTELVRIGKAVRIAIPPQHDDGEVRRDPALIKLVAKAHAARSALQQNNDLSLDEIARTQGYSRDYFAVLLRLSHLAPDIITAIVEGRQPQALSRQRLARMPHLPMAWPAQRALLGFA